jgi:hypothetical protein
MKGIQKHMSLSFNAERWIEFVKFLIAEMEALGRVAVSSNIPPVGHLDRVQYWRQMEAGCQVPIDASIRQWSRSERWSPVPEETRYCIHLRLLIITDFAATHICGEPNNPITLLAFPDGDFFEIAEWMLVDWWSHHGIETMARQRDPYA